MKVYTMSDDFLELNGPSDSKYYAIDIAKPEIFLIKSPLQGQPDTAILVCSDNTTNEQAFKMLEDYLVSRSFERED